MREVAWRKWFVPTPDRDTYDVLVSDRPYRQAFDRIRALRILHEECGTHLWEPAVRALLHSLGERWDDTMARQPRAA